MHTPFVQDHHVEAEPTSQSVNIANETSSNISNLNQSPKNLANEQIFEDFDDLLIDEDIAPTEPVRASSYAQSSAFVKAPIQTTIQADKLSKKSLLKLGRRLLENRRKMLILMKTISILMHR